MKRLALAATAALLLAGCGGSEDALGNEAPADHYTFVQELPNGGTVLCVWANTTTGHAGGISCDWEGVER